MNQLNENEERYEPRMFIIHGTTDEDFNLWRITATIALSSKVLVASLTAGSVNMAIDEKSMGTILCALGKNPLPVDQDCKTIKAMRNKF